MVAPELPFLYCDADLVAVHKPAGLLVHRTGLDRGERYFALQIVRDQLGERVYPLHRLDRPTSGILLFARSPEVASLVAAQFRAGTVHKRYLALVRGWPDTNGEIDHPLVDPDADPSQLKTAQTCFRVLERFDVPLPVGRYASARYALVEVEPRQGRRHQIRRHFKHRFHPLVGDVRYGDGRHNTLFRQHFDSHRLMLAATYLALVHPLRRVPLEISCTPGPDFMEVLAKLPVAAEPGTS